MASSTQLVTQDWIALSSALQKAADALSKFIFY